jgi:hypothetical protein
MDPFEMFKIVQDVYIAGLRAQAKAQTIERLTAYQLCRGSGLALMQKAAPSEDHSIAAVVCKDSRLAMQ